MNINLKIRDVYTFTSCQSLALMEDTIVKLPPKHNFPLSTMHGAIKVLSSSLNRLFLFLSAHAKSFHLCWRQHPFPSRPDYLRNWRRLSIKTFPLARRACHWSRGRPRCHWELWSGCRQKFITADNCPGVGGVTRVGVAPAGVQFVGSTHYGVLVEVSRAMHGGNRERFTDEGVTGDFIIKVFNCKHITGMYLCHEIISW